MKHKLLQHKLKRKLFTQEELDCTSPTLTLFIGLLLVALAFADIMAGKFIGGYWFNILLAALSLALAFYYFKLTYMIKRYRTTNYDASDYDDEYSFHDGSDQAVCDDHVYDLDRVGSVLPFRGKQEDEVVRQVPTEEGLLEEFEHFAANVYVYGPNSVGCQRTGADVSLTLVEHETLAPDGRGFQVHDFFLMRELAVRLRDRLNIILADNQPSTRPTERGEFRDYHHETYTDSNDSPRDPNDNTDPDPQTTKAP